MIPLIPAIVIAGAFIFGIIMYAGTSLLELQDLREDAATNTQERLQERLRGEYEGSPTNIQQATILSEWTDDTTIIGILVKCPTGDIYTIDVDERVRGGETALLSGTLTQSMEDAAGRC